MAGNLYIGGDFTNAGGMTANHIAKWNGSAWSTLGSGMNDAVNALVVVPRVGGGTDLCAGGDFTTAGGVANTNHIAKWNGSSWSALGSGVGNAVNALAVDGAGHLYAGAGPVVEQWDGSAWSTLGVTSISGILFYVKALAVVPRVGGGTDLYAGGDFTAAGEVPTNHIAKWDGTAWSALGSGMDDAVHALAVDGTGHLYAGSSSIMQWDGSAWLALGSGMNNAINALAVDGAGHLYAGGVFTSAGGVTAKYIAQWNGSVWSVLGSGMDDAVLALAVDGAGHLYAGGAFTTAGGVTVNHIAQWDGSAWLALGSGMDGAVNALAVVPRVGGGTDLYAGGDFTTAGGVTVNYIAQWNGSAWSPLGSGVGSTVYALAVDGSGHLYAGGGFTTAGGVTVSHIALWDGSAWSALGTGMVNIVHALAVDGVGHLYAGGAKFFTLINGAFVPTGDSTFIAQWDGSAWSDISFGVDSTVSALAVDGAGTLYAGGNFLMAGGGGTHIAHWDGSTWSPLGSGVDNGVNALSVDGAGHLYAGGNFMLAGNKLSPFIAQASLPVPAVTTPTSANVTSTTATLGGNVIDDGGSTITARGVVYAPTATNSNPVLGGNGVTNATTSGTSGVFNINVTSLTPGTDYTFKAYATNSLGTGYSTSSTFTTQSNSADLGSLVLSAGTLSPGFARGTIIYTASVPNVTTSLMVTPTVADATATGITVNGVAVASGSASGAITLNVGGNIITTVVTAQDGTTKTYTTTVTRLSSNADLSNIALSAGTLTPTFTSSAITYTASVPLATTSLTVTPTVADATATGVTVNGVAVTSGSASGAILLNAGSNVITTVVTAQDGSMKTYTTTVTRHPNANLTSMGLAVADLPLSFTPAFATGTTSYAATVAPLVASITITPTAEDATATVQVRVNGGSYDTVTTGSASSALLLHPGDNTVEVKMTAEDGSTQTYTTIVTRLANPGDPDSTYTSIGIDSGYDSQVNALAVQPTGHILAAGKFQQISGSDRSNFARLRPNGASDPAWNPSFISDVTSVATQADGKVIVAGSFLNSAGTVVQARLSRLNADGTLDTGFTPTMNEPVCCLAVQADGKILIGGGFISVNGQTRRGLARLNSDGTLDTSFNPNVLAPVPYQLIIQGIALQDDGKIIIHGDIVSVGGVGRDGIARLNPDGTLDTDWNPVGLGTISCLAVQGTTGRCIVSSSTIFQGMVTYRLRRILNNGSYDRSFSEGDAAVQIYSKAVQADGKIIILGGFSEIGGIHRVGSARLNANGEVDTSFDFGENGSPYVIALQGDGKMLLGNGYGSFMVMGTEYRGLTRVLNGPGHAKPHGGWHQPHPMAAWWHCPRDHPGNV